MRKILKFLIITALIMGIVFSYSLQVFAVAPYSSFTFDKYGKWVNVQAPFVPQRLIENIVSEHEKDTTGFSAKLRNPNDIFICDDDTLFIADTDNDRIIHMTDDGHSIKIIKGMEEDEKTLLRNPEGVFVDSNGIVYIADTGHKRVALFDNDGNYIREYTMPDSEYLPVDYKFVPQKVIVDVRGYLYIVTKQGYYGLTILKPNGEFETFYGSNKVNLSSGEKLKWLFLTDEQKKRSAVKLPGTITNAYIGEEGFIYTSTMNLDKGSIKKFNIAGEDMLDNMEFEVIDTIGAKRSFRDMTVDDGGNIACLDTSDSQIYIYDENGNPFFVFGTSSSEKSMLGVFGFATSLSFNSKGYLFVTDSKFNCIHVFKPTEFGKLVFKATELYNDGKYLESMEPWEQVLKLNSNFFRANLGIGKAQYKNGDWNEALESFKSAKSTVDYSNAYLKLRIEWTKKYFGRIFTSVFILMFLVLILRNTRKYWKKVLKWDSRR